MKRWQKVTLGIVGGIVAVALVVLSVVTRSVALGIVRRPISKRDPIDQTPSDYGMSYEDVSVTNADGLKLVGWYVPSQNGAMILLQHGGFGDRCDVLREGEIFQQRGYGVLFTTMHAHDLSEGELMGCGTNEWQDLEAWYQYLLTRDDFDHNRIGIYGRSYGGMVVIQYAAQNKDIKAVAVEGAIAALKDLVEVTSTRYTGLPPFPFAPMIQFWMENEAHFKFRDIAATKWIGDISPRPVLIMQGGTDQAIPVDSGQRLYDAAGEPKELWFEPQLGHCRFPEQIPEAFEERVVGFYDRYLLGE